MKIRAELFSIFQKFHAEICIQFNTSIRILKSDNENEYFSFPFSSFMSSHGILHQSTCAYTLQHNGGAKCKSCHLVEAAHTLLLHHNVPRHFRGDVILSACYLINRITSSVLHDQIPHSVLLPDQPLFCLPPRVFSCVYFVHILNLWARQTLHSSPDINRYFIFYVVTFFEDSSFSFATRPPMSNVISIPLISPSPNFPSPPPDVVTRPL